MFKSLSAGIAMMAVLGSVSAIAQQSQEGSIRFTWGDEYELPRHHNDLGFIGNQQDGYLQIGHDEHSSLSLQKFSPELKLTGEKKVDLSDLPRDYSIEQFLQLGGKYYWMFSTWERGEQSEKLQYAPIDLKKGAISGAPKVLVNTGKLGGDMVRTGIMSVGMRNKWHIFYSADKSKMLVEYRKKPERRNDSRNNDVIGFHVYDDNMNELWGREVHMPYTEKEMDNEDYTIDHNGNVYLLAKVNEEGGSRKTPDYHFEILKWTKDGADPVHISFRFADKFVNSALITEDFNGRLIVSGYYSMKKRSNSADGAYVLRLDENSNKLENVHKGTYEFPSSVLAEFESRRARRRIEKDDDAEATHMQLKNIVVNPDGSLQLFGEEEYVVVTTHYTGRSSYTTVHYYYNDILVMNIGADGEMKWLRKVPKNQVGTSGRGGMSFKQFSYNKNHYLFFLDNEKNLDIQKDEAPATHMDGKGGILMVVKIDDSGKMTKKSIFDVREEHKKLRVTEFDDVSDNEIITRAWGRHDVSQPALITFE